MGAPELMDLDFTMVAKVPAVRRETALGPDSEIGVTAGSGNFIFYTRAAARRYLLTLTAAGYASFDGKRFALTPRVLRLGYLAAAVSTNAIFVTRPDCRSAASLS